jgi:hypothetical protein
MELKDLTPEQKAALKEQLAAEERTEKERIKKEKDTYKTLQHEFVEQFFPKLAEIAGSLTLAKAELFDEVKTILDIKKQLYNITDEAFAQQQSHSISNANYTKTIILGHNVIDGWDSDLASAGIAKVNDWLTKKMKVENQELINIIRDLLKPNKDGLLKANRVMELHTQAEKIGDAELIEAVGIIKEAYRPAKTTTYVKAKMRDDDGRDVWLNLSMSQA